MGILKCVWRIHDGYSGNEYMNKEFVFIDGTLPYLHIVLDPSNNQSIPKEKFRLDFIFPKATSAMKVKYHILVMQKETLSEFTGKVLLSQDTCPTTVTKFVRVTKDKILDSIICIVKYNESAQPSVTDHISLGSLLWNETEFTDGVLVSCDNCSFPVHRGVLAVHSPVFHDMFAIDKAEKQCGVVAISDLDGEVLDRLLAFVYNADTNAVTDDNMTSALLAAADKYALDALKKACEYVLAKRLNAENVVDTLVLADVYGAEELKCRVMDFITKCGKEVIDSAKFRELETSKPQLAIQTFRTMLRE